MGADLLGVACSWQSNGTCYIVLPNDEYARSASAVASIQLIHGCPSHAFASGVFIRNLTQYRAPLRLEIEGWLSQNDAASAFSNVNPDIRSG
jgi:hypothetical protein